MPGRTGNNLQYRLTMRLTMRSSVIRTCRRVLVSFAPSGHSFPRRDKSVASQFIAKPEIMNLLHTDSFASPIILDSLVLERKGNLNIGLYRAAKIIVAGKFAIVGHVASVT